MLVSYQFHKFVLPSRPVIVDSLDYLDMAGYRNKAGCNGLGSFDKADCSKAADTAPAFLHAVQASSIAGSAAGFASGFAAISTAAG